MNESLKLTRLQFLQLLSSVLVFMILGILFRIPFAHAFNRDRPKFTNDTNAVTQITGGPVISEITPKNMIAGIKIVIRGTGLRNCDTILIGGFPCKILGQSENLIFTYVPPKSQVGRSIVLARTFDGKTSNPFEITIMRTFVVAIFTGRIKDRKLSSMLAEKIQSQLGPDQIVVKRVFPYSRRSVKIDARSQEIAINEESFWKNITRNSEKSQYRSELFAMVKEDCSNDLIPKTTIDMIIVEKGSGEISFLVNPNCEDSGKIAFLRNQMSLPVGNGYTHPSTV